MSRQLFKDTAFYGAADLILKLISFFTFPIFANLFTLKDYGVLTTAGIVAGIFGLFMNLGINNAIQRFYFDPETKDVERGRIITAGFWVLLFWSCFLTAIGILLTLPLKSIFLQRYQVPWEYIALSILASIPAQILAYCNDTIRLHFKPINFFILALIKNLSAVVAGIIALYYFKVSITTYLWVGFLVQLVFIPFAVWLIRKDFEFSFDFKWAKILVKFGYPFVFAGIGFWLFGTIDRWLLSELSNPEEVGLFSVGFKLVTILTFVNSAFSQAWSPVAIKMMADNPNGYRSQFVEIINFYFWFVTFLSAGICLYANEFMVLTAPKPYWASVNVTCLLMLGVAISCTTQVTAIGISIAKQTKLISRAAWITAIVNVVVNACLIPYFGALGSAFATAVSYLVLTATYIYYTQRVHPLPFDYKQMFITLLVLIGFVCLSMATNHLYNLKVTILKTVVLAAVIAVFFYFKRNSIKAIIALFINK
jgi:O-antigen/teichoic acid export membrane protein